MIKNYRKTKILATIGPSSEKIKTIEKLVLNGVDAFRINCSHSKNEQLTSYVENIRKVEKKLKQPIGILIDLQGPKLRIGEIKNNYMELKKGQKIILVNKKTVSNSNEIPLPDKNIFPFLFNLLSLKKLLNDSFISLNRTFKSSFDSAR